MMLQLAGPAQKQARQAADHLMGRPVRNTGYIGSSCIRVFGYNAASTGLTEAQCQQEGLAYEDCLRPAQGPGGPDARQLSDALQADL